MAYTFHCGIDLGSKRSQIAIIDNEQRVILNEKLDNDLGAIRQRLSRFNGQVQAVVESTCNWYWLVDGLQEASIPVTLAHTARLAAISSAKVKTDRRDALTLAQLLRVGMIPPAYIYPADHRPTRDLVRHRWDLVSMRATEYRRIRQLLAQHGIWNVGLGDIKALDEEEVGSLLKHPLTQTKALLEKQRIALCSQQIALVEEQLEQVVSPRPEFDRLKEIPGIGTVLALTILSEIGDITRFQDVRHFSSYCRVVGGCANSSESQRRGRNDKSGNPYLKWAFTQAATKAVTHYPAFRQFFDRQLRRHGGRAKKLVCYSITAHLLAKAAFHVLKTGEPYSEEILFRHQPKP
jgi:transposase